MLRATSTEPSLSPYVARSIDVASQRAESNELEATRRKMHADERELASLVRSLARSKRATGTEQRSGQEPSWYPLSRAFYDKSRATSKPSLPGGSRAPATKVEGLAPAGALPPPAFDHAPPAGRAAEVDAGAGPWPATQAGQGPAPLPNLSPAADAGPTKPDALHAARLSAEQAEGRARDQSSEGPTSSSLALEEPDLQAETFGLTRFPWELDASTLSAGEQQTLAEAGAEGALNDGARFGRLRAAHRGVKMERRTLELRQSLLASSARIEELACRLQLTAVPDRLMNLFGGPEAFAGLHCVSLTEALALRGVARPTSASLHNSLSPRPTWPAAIVTGHDREALRFIQLQLFHRDRPVPSYVLLQQEKETAPSISPSMGAAHFSLRPATARPQHHALLGHESSTASPKAKEFASQADALRSASAQCVALAWRFDFPEGLTRNLPLYGRAQRVIRASMVPGKLPRNLYSQVEPLLATLQRLIVHGEAQGWILGDPSQSIFVPHLAMDELLTLEDFDPRHATDLLWDPSWMQQSQEAGPMRRHGHVTGGDNSPPPSPPHAGHEVACDEASADADDDSTSEDTDSSSESSKHREITARAVDVEAQPAAAVNTSSETAAVSAKTLPVGTETPATHAAEVGAAATVPQAANLNSRSDLQANKGNAMHSPQVGQTSESKLRPSRVRFTSGVAAKQREALDLQPVSAGSTPPVTRRRMQPLARLSAVQDAVVAAPPLPKSSEQRSRNLGPTGFGSRTEPVPERIGRSRSPRQAASAAPPWQPSRRPVGPGKKPPESLLRPLLLAGASSQVAAPPVLAPPPSKTLPATAVPPGAKGSGPRAIMGLGHQEIGGTTRPRAALASASSARRVSFADTVI